MKKSIGLLVATCLVTTIGLTSCKTSNEKVEDAQEKVVDAKENEMEAEKELTDKKMDSVTDYAKMKTETQRLVEKNEAKIAEFKMKLKTEKEENQKKFEAKIDKLEEKNNRLKADLNAYSENGKESWNTFKMRVQNSIDDMNKDIDNYKKEHNY
jgi:cell shape-determining protein MreC